VRHCELQESRGRRRLSPGPAAPGQGQGQEAMLPVPVEALLDALSLVGHGEALARDLQGNVFGLRHTGRREERGSEGPSSLGADHTVPAFSKRLCKLNLGVTDRNTRSGAGHTVFQRKSTVLGERAQPTVHPARAGGPRQGTGRAPAPKQDHPTLGNYF